MATNSAAANPAGQAAFSPPYPAAREAAGGSPAGQAMAAPAGSLLQFPRPFGYPQQPLQWVGLGNGTGAGIAIIGNIAENRPGGGWNCFVDGVFGSASNATAQMQISPDNLSVPDASAAWYNVSAWSFTSQANAWQAGLFWRVRPVVSGGDGHTALRITLL